MENERNDRHCAEVKELMGGKMPFVTRHGITIVIAVIDIVVGLLSFMDGEVAELVRGLLGRISVQIAERTNIPGGL